MGVAGIRFLYIVVATVVAVPALGLELDFAGVMRRAQSDTIGRQRVVELHRQSLAQIGQGRAGALPQINLSTTLSQVRIAQFDKETGAAAEGQSYGWELTLAQPLFAFGRIYAVWTIADETKRFTEVKRVLDGDLYHLSIIQTYAAALQAEDRARTLSHSERQLRSVLDFAEVEAAGGGMNRVDLYKIRASVRRAAAAALQAKAGADSGLARLKVALNLPQNQPVTLSAIKDTRLGYLVSPLAGRQPMLETRLKRHESVIRDKNIIYRRADFGPTFSLFGSLSGSALDVDAGPSQSFNDSWKESQRSYAVGVRMDWPLFTGLRTTHATREARADAALAKLELEQLVTLEDSRYREAQQTLEASKQLFLASQLADEANELFFNKTKEDFTAGTETLTELLRAETEQSQGRQELSQAWVNWLLAMANMRLANGQRVYDAG